MSNTVVISQLTYTGSGNYTFTVTVGVANTNTQVTFGTDVSANYDGVIVSIHDNTANVFLTPADPWHYVYTEATVTTRVFTVVYQNHAGNPTFGDVQWMISFNKGNSPINPFQSTNTVQFHVQTNQTMLRGTTRAFDTTNSRGVVALIEKDTNTWFNAPSSMIITNQGWTHDVEPNTTNYRVKATFTAITVGTAPDVATLVA